MAAAQRRRPRRRARSGLVALVTLLAALFAACGGGGADGAAIGGSDDPVVLGLLSIGYPVYEDEASGIRTILGTPDLGAGRHRVGFVLSDDDGLIRLPVITVTSYRYPQGPDGPRVGPVEQGTARFFEFPYGVRGMFSLELTLDEGTWGVELAVPRPDGTTARPTFTFPVAARTVAPAVGDPARPSEHRTAADVASLAELTTSSEPVPALYQRTIAQAIEEPLPFVVVFASPAFCTNALCGPQVEVVGELAAEYGDRANFIHVDLYENPHEIKGDLSRAIRTPVLEQWGIETDEWTFVVDADGVISARFEAFVTRAELEEALVAALKGGS